jgi:hypothetical protein
MKGPLLSENNSPEYCLARAEQCENLASQTSFESTRLTFLMLAEQWRALALRQPTLLSAKIPTAAA